VRAWMGFKFGMSQSLGPQIAWLPSQLPDSSSLSHKTLDEETKYTAGSFIIVFHLLPPHTTFQLPNGY
jgi:hypothetical protein